jgi:hypothetical protein
MSLCKCGCGQEVSPNKTWIKGHSSVAKRGTKYTRKDKRPLSEVSYTTVHQRVRAELINENSVCSKCGISELEHKRLHKGRGLEIHSLTGEYSNIDEFIILCHREHRALGVHSDYSPEARAKLKHKINGVVTSKRDYPNKILNREDN